MLRRAFLLSLIAPALAADPRQEIYDLFGSLASALTDGEPEQFLAAFDRSMKGYEDFAANVRALVAQMDVTSTVELVDDAGDARHRAVKFDWLMQLANKNDRVSVIRRQQTITCRLEKQKRKWRIVSLEPLDFFAPPRIAQP